jgi:vacuolar protein sorting-associated protein 45
MRLLSRSLLRLLLGAVQLLAQRLAEVMRDEPELFKFGRSDGENVLLILDRREDPVTPLLSQWTYQAMIHELLGIRRNTVNLSGAVGIHADLKYG